MVKKENERKSLRHKPNIQERKKNVKSYKNYIKNIVSSNQRTSIINIVGFNFS